MVSTTLVDMLRARAESNPEGWAYSFLGFRSEGVFEAERLTWGELDRRARAVAARLQGCEARGERILLLYPPGLEFIAAFFGCLYAGAVAVPSYPPGAGRSQPRLRAILSDARPHVALTTRGIAAKWGRDSGLTVLATEDLTGDEADAWIAHAPEPGDLAFLQYTSGSTSDPKGVMVTHGNLIHNHLLIRDACGHDEGSTFVSWLPMYHDMGLIGCVLQPLFVGAPCVLMSPLAFLQKPERWLRAVDRYRAHTSGAPNFAYDLCVRKIPPERREGLDLSAWQVAFNGAEPVHAATLDAFAEAFAPCGFRREAFFPCYGLAEATLIVSGRERPEAPVVQRFRGLDEGRPVPDPAAPALVASGEILSGQRVAIVDPATGGSVGAGRIGEIWISGPSVALGYWGRPEQTEHDFRARLPGASEPYLRTGDLGFLQDGRLFVAGRLKDLIIVHGRNHYPQDVERTAEASHAVLRPGAGAAFAVDLPGGEGMALVHEADPRHGVAQGAEAIEAIRRAVAEEHGVALAGVALVRPGTVPKTTSGKIQRQLCRRLYLEWALAPLAEWRWSPEEAEVEPGTDLAGAVAPGEVLSWLCRRVARELGVEPSGIDPERSLPELGLDSIQAIELGHAMAAEHGVELPLDSLLEAPSLARLAARVEEALRAAPASAEAAAAAHALAAGDVPLAPGPRGLWLLQSLDPESPAYNIAGAARILGEVDDAALRRAFAALVARHSVLRSTFPARGGEPVQRIAPAGEPDFEHAVTELHGEDLLELLAGEANRPFDLERGPLLRVRRVDAPGERLFLLTLHHLVADLWSMAVLLDELGALYAIERGEAAAVLAPPPGPLPEIPEAGMEEAAGRWRARLEGYPVLLDLPVDRSRPPRPRHRAAGCHVELGAETEERLRELARRQGATLFATLLAGFEAWLHRVTGRERLLVGSPSAGRDRAELSRRVGYLVQTAVLPADSGGDPDFASYLERTRSAVLETMRDALPLPRLVDAVQPERDPARHPLFQAMFALQKAPLPSWQRLAAFALGSPGARLDVGGLALESVRLPEVPGPFDLVLLAAELDGRLAASLQVDLDLFDPVTGRRLARQIETLLAAAAADPRRRLSELLLLGDGERWQLLGEWNGMERPRRGGRFVPRRVRDVARSAPGSPAVVHGERILTYEELARRVGSLAGHLRSLGVMPEDRVAVVSERSPEMVVGLLAVLEAGAAYVPVDPADPADRVEWMLRDCGARAVLAPPSLAERLAATEVPVVLLEDRDAGPTAEPAPPLAELDADNLAYVIYTSGSSGRPKAVQVSHGALACLVDWHLETFGLTAADVVSHVAGVAFDASVWEIWPCLSAGARLELPPEEVRTAPAALGSWLAERSVTVAFAPTPLAHELLALELESRHLRILLTGGDELHARPRTGLGFRLWNNYGPTEGTVVATSGPVASEEAGTPDIGRPVQHARVHLLDRSLWPVPPGVPGELCLAGAGLARGYLGRPGLTAERFVPDPLAPAAGGRLYRTGDLARWRPDGTLAFLGRLDHQIKVRGIRVEPAEIEEALCRHPAVTDAVVLASGRGEERRLVAFVAAGAVEPRELRELLAAGLPAAMVPARFVFLDALPRTSNGKVDRRVLLERAAVEESVQGPADLPGNPVEEIVAGILAEVLGRGSVGLRDDFFELGGHSLLAARAAARVREALGAEIPLSRLFESPTAAGLAVAVVEALGSGRPAAEPPRPRPGRGDVPLTSGQERLWFLDRLQPGAAYNVPVEARLTGALPVPALASALAELERRHEALRSTFPAVDGAPVQRVGAPAGPALPVVDLGGLEEARRSAEAARLARDEARRPFDLAAGPVIRHLLVRLEEGGHRLLWTLHHIVCDGRSLEVLLAELTVLYAAALEGRPSLLPAPLLQIADVAVWERERLAGPALDENLAYWERALADTSPLEVSADRPRPPVQSLRGGTRTREISASLARSASILARRERATPFLLLLAAFVAQLHRSTGQRDLTVGSPLAGRGHAGLEGVVGFLVNTVALRVEASRSLPFRELLARVRRSVLEAFGHAGLPFEKVVERLQPERALSHNPLFQVSFALQPARGPVALPGQVLEPRAVETGTAKLDLGMTVEWSEGGCAASLEHADFFDSATADRLLGHFATLLAGVVEEPDRAVGDLPLLPAAERFQVLVEWNQTAAPVGWLAVHQEVAAWAARRPDAPAVVEEGAGLTFRELDLRAARIGRILRDLGVGPETVVPVLARRAPALASATLGVLHAGGAYAPLDPASPAGRLETMLREVGAGVVLAEGDLAHLLPAAVRVVLPDGEEVEAAEPLRPAERAMADPDQLAYLVFTSGSTGVPKAVALHHGPLAGLAAWTRRTYGIGPEDRGGQMAGPAFDASVWEIWTFLTAGAGLFRPGEEVRLAASRLVNWMAAERLTVTFLPTPVAELVLAEPWPAGAPLRALLTGGDRLHRRPELRHPFALTNHYGPSEATGVTTWGRVAPEGEAAGGLPTIGAPIANARVSILDAGLEPSPLGMPGELCVGGDILARGYFGRPDLTAERFVPDPFRDLPGARLYRTGDLARWLPTGEIEFLGRLDHQVKLRGLRIEIGEIEAALAAHPGVREAVATLRADPQGEPRLVAWVAGLPDAPVPADLRQFLLARLPASMIPSALVPVPEIPLTSNGKVDRSSLPEPDWSRPELAGEHVAPRTAIESRLAGIWTELLGAEQIGVHDSFFELGGHSLKAARLVSRLREAFGIELPVRTVFEAPTVASLAEAVAARLSGSAAVAAPDSFRPRARPDSRSPLSFGQQQLWLIERMEPGTSAFNLPAALACRGSLDVDALHRALGTVVRRHEVLRARFDAGFESPGGEPVQVVEPAAPFHLEIHDLSGLSAEETRMEADRRTAEEAARPFDLAAGPLLRAALLRLGPDEDRLLLTLHHIAADAWSLGILGRELGDLYAAFTAGEPPSLPPLPAQYADYAAWQRERLRGERLERLLAYWKEVLAGRPASLELPADHARPPVQSLRGARMRVHLGGHAAAARSLGAREGASLFMVLLTAFETLLLRTTGQDDLLVGTPVASRPSPSLEGVIGFFVNTVVLRCRLEGDPTFRQALGRVRAAALEAFFHDEAPFSAVVDALQPERDLSRHPLFQVFFATTSDGASMALRLPGVAMEPVETHSGAGQFDLSLVLDEGEASLGGWLEYNPDLFERATVERLAGHLARLLAAAVESPGRRLSELPLLGEEERGQLLAGWNKTRAPFDDRSIHELFAEQVRRTPGAVAAVCRREERTYGELAARARRLALRLRRLGVRPGDRVAVCVERSLALPEALLGVLEAGGAYVPLDPTYPPARLRFMLDDSAARVLVTTRRAGSEAVQEGRTVLRLDDFPDDGSAGISGGSSGPHPGSAAPAYQIYTSGSTGTPKGVVVTHRNVANFFAAMDPVAGRPAGGESPGVWLAVTSASFDISVLELLWTLTRGFRVVIQEEAMAIRPSSRAAVRPVRFSLFYFADAAGAAGETAERYRLLLDGARFADERGFHAVWTPERHFHSFGGLYPNPSVTGAAVAAVTRRVGVRAGSVVLPLHDPVRVAEEWSVVDNLSGGRAGISVASGWHADDFVFAPDLYERRHQEMLRGIETVRRLWRGEAVERRGGAGNEVAVRIQPPPVQPELPVWITAAGNPETFRLAGEQGTHLLTHLLGQSVEELGEKIALYRAAWRDAGHPGEGTVTVMLHTFVGEDEERVRETVREPFTGYLRSSVGLVRSLARSLGLGDDLERLSAADMDTLLEHAFDRYWQSNALLGTAGTCRRMVERLQAVGADELACLIDFGVKRDAAMAALEHLDALRREMEPAAAVEEDVSLPAQIARHGVTHLQCTPSLAGLVAAEPAALAAVGGLRKLLLGGEALPEPLADRLAGMAGGPELWNMYGPTETTVWSLCHRVEPGAGRVPIGRPVLNTEAYVLDAWMQPVPVGVPGELYLGGDGATAGYWRRPALTAERFVPASCEDRPGARLYRTGDLARRRPDGILDFLGRTDHQVKVRGHRIELGEVEAALLAHPGVREAAVVVRDDVPDGAPGGGPRLVAYTVSAGPPPLAPVRELPPGMPRFTLPNGLLVTHLSDFQANTGYRELFEDEVYLRHGIDLPDGAVILDVGANIGFFSLFAHQRAVAPQVFAFEPMPPTFAALSANVALYGLDVQLFNCGVADRAGPAELFFYPKAPGLSGRFAGTEDDRAEVRAIVEDWMERVAGAALPAGEIEAVLDEHLRTETFTGELVTLSDVLREHGLDRVDLLKVDAERSELDILRGLRDEDWPKVDQIVLEVHTRELLEEISALLSGRGFDLAVEDVAVVEEREGRPPVRVHMLYARSERLRGRAAATGRAGALSAGELRRWLAERLPEPLVPADFVSLPALPRTANGKLDRRALPAPGSERPTAEAPYVPPRTRTEEAVAAVWRRVLGRDRVGVHDNFFEVGGNSLLLVQLQSSLQQALDREVPLVQMFRHPTIHTLAGLLSRDEGARRAEAGEPGRSRAEVPADGLLDRQKQFLAERKQRRSAPGRGRQV